jgi:hypothetical protein
MWNNKKYAAMAVLGVGLTVAAVAPASAWWPGAYDNARGCGYYGYAPTYGYAGVYSYGWPYGTVGYGRWGAYGYASGDGYAGGRGYGAYGYGPLYGGSGYGPAYYGHGCHARHLHGQGGYTSAYAPRSSL